ncbi:Uncharacterised protein [uncultured archaeon]|nr:Uncharacterised protein [uncultured archaeon]
MDKQINMEALNASADTFGIGIGSEIKWIRKKQ